MDAPYTDPRDFKRIRRHDGPSTAHFLTFSCLRNQPFLRSNRACGWFMDAIRAAREKHRFHLWAWTAMPTHAHMLVWTPPGASGMSAALKSLKQSVSRRAVAHVRKHSPSFLPRMLDSHPTGSAYRFWQRGPGYDRNLWTATHIWKAIRYIHANAVAAELCEHEQEWRWSSAAAYHARRTGRGADELLSIDWTSLPAEV